MKITTITVRSGYTTPHPNEGFANLQGSIELSATIETGDDIQTAARDLQITADALAKQHKQQQVDAVMASLRLACRQREIALP